MGLDRDQHRAVQRRRQVVWQDGGHGHGEVLHRPFDPEPALADRLDHVRISVADQPIVAVTHQTCGDSAADRPAAKHQVSHGVSRYNTVTPESTSVGAIYKSPGTRHISWNKGLLDR